MTITTRTTTDKPRKGGSQQGNLNSAKNGSRMRLQLGELPSALERVTRWCRQYRRLLENAVADANGGQVTLTQAHLIDAACTHERHGKVCAWLLQQRLDKMTVADIRECSRQIGVSRDARNRAVMALELDKKEDPFAWLYSQPVEQAGSQKGNGAAAQGDAGRDAAVKDGPGVDDGADATDATLSDLDAGGDVELTATNATAGDGQGDGEVGSDA